MDEPAKTLLSALKNDHQSGATALALETLRQLEQYVINSAPPLDRLARLLENVRLARPSMVVIGNAIARLETSLACCPESPLTAIQQIQGQLRHATSKVVELTTPRVPEHAVIMTHSASSVAMTLFQTLARENRRFSVICTQSSPGFEGHDLAKALNRAGIPVTLISDAQMGLFIGKADMVMTGCDCWLRDHHFINKAGTRLLALAAADADTPFWVLADSFRDSPETSQSITLEEMPGAELGAPEGQWITPRNVYFEAIPERLVTGRISDRGVSLFPVAAPR